MQKTHQWLPTSVERLTNGASASSSPNHHHNQQSSPRKSTSKFTHENAKTTQQLDSPLNNNNSGQRKPGATAAASTPTRAQVAGGSVDGETRRFLDSDNERLHQSILSIEEGLANGSIVRQFEVRAPSAISSHVFSLKTLALMSNA